MSFDIFLVPLDRPDAPFDVAAVEAILAADARADGPPGLTTSDGGADVYGAPSAGDWLMVNHVEGVAAWQIMWELAGAGPYAVMPTGCPTFVASVNNVVTVPDEAAAPVIVVASGEELRRAVSGLEALPPFEPGSATDAFRRFTAARAVSIARLGVTQIVALMTSWYELQQARGVAIDEDGDMLLFQWGTYDWGAGASLHYDLTRQLTFTKGSGDAEIWQLSLTAHFPTSAESDRLGRGHHWCHRPDGLAEFQRHAMQARATQQLRDHSPVRTELAFDRAD